MTDPAQQPAEMLARLGRHWGWLLAYGILTLLAAIAVPAYPGLTLVGLAVVLGVWLAIFGVMRSRSPSASAASAGPPPAPAASASAQPADKRPRRS